MKVVKTENYNTNNDWGFGGGVGVETTYDNGLITRKGKDCFRHFPPEPYFKLYIEFEGENVYVSGIDSLKQFQSLRAVSVYKNEYVLIARAGDAEELKTDYYGMAKRVHTITINH